jgi:hypothetical protein
VLAGGAAVGRIFKAAAAPVGSPWMWTLAFGHHEDRTPTHGYAAICEAAMAAFGKKLAVRVNGSFVICCMGLPATLIWYPLPGVSQVADDSLCRNAQPG